MNLKCRLFGHKISKDFTDGGYHICEWCHMHEYWDSKNIMIQHELKFKYSFESAGLLLKPFLYIYRKFDNFRINIRFWFWFYGSKIISKFSKHNNDDLPF